MKTFSYFRVSEFLGYIEKTYPNFVLKNDQGFLLSKTQNFPIATFLKEYKTFADHNLIEGDYQI